MKARKLKKRTDINYFINKKNFLVYCAKNSTRELFKLLENGNLDLSAFCYRDIVYYSGSTFVPISLDIGEEMRKNGYTVEQVKEILKSI